MQIAVLLFDRFTALDAVGPYEVLGRLPGARTVFVADRPGPVTTDVGALALTATATLDEVTRPDVLVVPGGPGQIARMTDARLLDWLRAVDTATTWTTSVCTGSLLLAAAGLLAGRRATSHWLALDQLPAFGAAPAEERVVVDGKYVTAAGVSAGVDMALTLAGRIAGEAVAQAVQLGIEYDPRPPYPAGSPRTAPAPLVAALRADPHRVLG
ncbi:DJ-1/PfpI family protein [Micromonospora terminaliae]|uniref:DJ-1/PfpI family protein n=1 Tax=Micromonospora terminaliae TaxID=1914461 RepID=A0AAJ2ZI66_9ACTN|nr:DJ-1/PfpI family protein [Micromonospora terminaliae]NES30171.1 DJ-1/PfpI family protein [Micromonospora terminaliae]QGL47055.1 DJ-1/PfpI family protein [Micromonospora terminaliae]